MNTDLFLNQTKTGQQEVFFVKNEKRDMDALCNWFRIPKISFSYNEAQQ